MCSGQKFVVVSKWRPPDAGWTNVNVDGGWDWASKKAGLSRIFRDNTGKEIIMREDYGLIVHS
jgi:hypothetical protein